MKLHCRSAFGRWIRAAAVIASATAVSAIVGCSDSSWAFPPPSEVLAVVQVMISNRVTIFRQ